MKGFIIGQCEASRCTTKVS